MPPTTRRRRERNKSPPSLTFEVVNVSGGFFQDEEFSFHRNVEADELTALVRERLHAILAERLGSIEGSIGSGDEVLDARGVGRYRRHADAHGDFSEWLGVLAGKPSSLDPEPHFLRGGESAVFERRRKDNRELFPTVTAHDVDVTNAFVEHAGDSFQRGVSCEMSVLIVEPLEIIDVNHQERHTSVVATHPLDLLFDPVLEVAVVVDPSKLVHKHGILRLLKELDLDDRWIPQLLLNLQKVVHHDDAEVETRARLVIELFPNVEELLPVIFRPAGAEIQMGDDVEETPVRVRPVFLLELQQAAFPRAADQESLERRDDLLRQIGSLGRRLGHEIRDPSW